jgi:hypothetical protein
VYARKLDLLLLRSISTSNSFGLLTSKGNLGFFSKFLLGAKLSGQCSKGSLTFRSTVDGLLAMGTELGRQDVDLPLHLGLTGDKGGFFGVGC